MSCPHCGYCQHCGRSNYSQPYMQSPQFQQQQQQTGNLQPNQQGFQLSLANIGSGMAQNTQTNKK